MFPFWTYKLLDKYDQIEYTLFYARASSQPPHGTNTVYNLKAYCLKMHLLKCCFSGLFKGATNVLFSCENTEDSR